MPLVSTVSIDMQPPGLESPESDDDIDGDLADLLDADCVPDSDPECNEVTETETHTSLPTTPAGPVSTAPSTSGASELAGISHQRSSILGRLMQKGQDNLSGTVAGIVRDAEEAIERARSGCFPGLNDRHAPTPIPEPKFGNAEPQNFADIMRKRRQRTNDAPIMSDAQRRKKARNAFAVIGKKATKNNTVYEFDDDRFSGMRLCKVMYSQSALAGLFENFMSINISDVPEKALEIRAGQIKEYMVYGCLVKKVSKKTAKNGKRYAVWMLSNMPMYIKGKSKHTLTSINCLVFDSAFEALHTQVEGTVFALRKPKILPPRETLSALSDDSKAKKRGHSEWSGYCLSISKASHVQAIAHATNFGICAAENQQGERCGRWYHTHISSLCHFHTKEKLKRQTSTRRPVINAAERPGVAREDFVGTDPAHNISKVEAPQVINSKFQAQNVVRDEEQIFRDNRDRNKTNKLVNEMLQKRKNSYRGLIAHKQTLAQFRKEEAKRRLPQASTCLTARPGFGTTLLLPRGQAATGAHAGSIHVGAAQPSAQVSKERTDPQERYRRARDTLLAFGFKLRSDGGFAPPTLQRCRENGIQISIGDDSLGPGGKSSMRRSDSSRDCEKECAGQLPAVKRGVPDMSGEVTPETMQYFRSADRWNKTHMQSRNQRTAAGDAEAIVSGHDEGTTAKSTCVGNTGLDEHDIVLSDSSEDEE